MDMMTPSDSEPTSSGLLSPSPLAEAEPTSLELLFATDPLKLRIPDDTKLECVIIELRKARPQWAEQSEQRRQTRQANKATKETKSGTTKRRKKADVITIDNNITLEDLGL